MSFRPNNSFDRLANQGDGVLSTGKGTEYFSIDILDAEVVSLHLSTPDATANSAYTLEGTNFDERELSVSAVDTRWAPLPITVTAPTSAASTLISFSNLGCKRLRLKVVPSSDTNLQLRHYNLPC